MQRARLCPRAPVLCLLSLLLVVATHLYRTSAGEDTPEVKILGATIYGVINGWEKGKERLLNMVPAVPRVIMARGLFQLP